MKIGENIRKFRVLKGYSQEYMANVLEISQRNYSKIERNEIKVTDDKIFNIAKILEIQPQNLICFEESFSINKSINNSPFEKIEILFKNLEERISYLENELLLIRKNNLPQRKDV